MWLRQPGLHHRRQSPSLPWGRRPLCALPLQVLAALFAVYQAHLTRPELRPLAAQMLRCAAGGGGALSAVVSRTGGVHTRTRARERDARRPRARARGRPRRTIHLLVRDNDVAKESCRDLGLLRRLADQLRLDMAAASEPGQPVAVSAVAALMNAHQVHGGPFTGAPPPCLHERMALLVCTLPEVAVRVGSVV